MRKRKLETPGRGGGGSTMGWHGLDPVLLTEGVGEQAGDVLARVAVQQVQEPGLGRTHADPHLFAAHVDRDPACPRPRGPGTTDGRCGLRRSGRLADWPVLRRPGDRTPRRPARRRRPRSESQSVGCAACAHLCLTASRRRLRGNSEKHRRLRLAVKRLFWLRAPARVKALVSGVLGLLFAVMVRLLVPRSR